MESAFSSSAAPLGGHVGKYRILDELGRGSSGVVYRALDEELDRHVALKSPLLDDEGPNARAQVLKEARAAARISHPHVVSVFDVFEHERRLWIAMEFLNGSTLRDVLNRQGRLSIEEALVVGEQIAEGLEAAHSQGILHRDVKPGNIMLMSPTDARLMDFSVARSDVRRRGYEAYETSITTLSKGIIGTIGYVSPEQILGRPIGPSSDVFGLGVVLYEVITGRQPFAAETIGEVFDATLHTSPRLLTQCAPEAPTELERIVSKALAKRPDERYQSAGELAVDLRTLRRRFESSHIVAPVLPLPSPNPLRRRTVRVMAALASTIVVGGLVGWFLYQGMVGSKVELGPPQQLTAGQSWDADPALSPDGSLVAYASDAGGNPDIWLLDIRNGVSVDLTSGPENDRAPAWYPDGGALAFVSDRGGTRSIWKTTPFGGPPSLVISNAEDPAIGPDGRSIAFARRDQTGLYRIGVASIDRPDEARSLTTNESDVQADHRKPAWSPDGRQIVYETARDLWIVASTGGRARQLTFAGKADREPVWSPDGRFIFFSSDRDGTRALWRVSVFSGNATRLTGGQGPERYPTLSRNPTRLAYSTFVDDSNVVLRDLKSGREQQFGSERFEESPVFSPDGRGIAFVSDRWLGRYDLWFQPIDPDGRVTGEARRLTDQPGSVAQPAFSPDGRWIAYHRVAEGRRNIWVVSSSGGAPLQITSDSSFDVEPSWSPDGRSIAFVSTRSGTGQLWIAPVTDGRSVGAARRLETPPGADAPSWSPDGTMIAFVGADTDVWMIRADGRSAPRRVTKGADVMRVCWNNATGELWASGLWGEKNYSVRALDINTGTSRALSAPISLSGRLLTDFDILQNGRFVAFARQEPRGHLWLQEIVTNRF